MSRPSESLRQTCRQFLQSPPDARRETLERWGIARYAEFLMQLSDNEANYRCLMRFFRDRRSLKFPRLANADLSGLTLDRANLIRGDLSGANLRRTRLRHADLLFANFTRADLTDADLRGATLYETTWNGAIVAGCCLAEAVGLTAAQIAYLGDRGAQFET